MDPDDNSVKSSAATGLFLSDAAAARMQRNIGRALFAARWIMAPVYFGLLAAMALVVIKFTLKLITASFAKTAQTPC